MLASIVLFMFFPKRPGRNIKELLHELIDLLNECRELRFIHVGRSQPGFRTGFRQNGKTGRAVSEQKMALLKPILTGFEQEGALLRIHIHPKILQVVKSQQP